MIWRRYRRLLIAVGLLIASYFLVSLLHDDYLDYVKNSGNADFLGLSYVVKWAVLLVVTIVFYFLIGAHKTDKAKNIKPKKETQTAQTAQNETNAPDPFEAIRLKKKLRGHADQYLGDGKHWRIV